MSRNASHARGRRRPLAAEAELEELQAAMRSGRYDPPWMGREIARSLGLIEGGAKREEAKPDAGERT